MIPRCMLLKGQEQPARTKGNVVIRTVCGQIRKEISMFREDQLIRPGLLANCVIKTSTSFACQSRRPHVWRDVLFR